MIWWGEFDFDNYQTLSWKIGKREVVIERLPSEWKIWNIESDENPDADMVQGSWDGQENLPEDCLLRSLQRQTEEQIIIAPALADRPFVARPASPLNVLPGEEVWIYVSTPLWFQARTKANNIVLFDVPFKRPSDSWFGPQTRTGEMCYAKYTDARINLQNIERRAHRAITAVQIINKHKDNLAIERLSLPVPYLSLFVANDDQLWTEVVKVTREPVSDTAEVHLEKTPRSDIVDPVLVSNARTIAEKRTLIRSLGSLFA